MRVTTHPNAWVVRDSQGELIGDVYGGKGHYDAEPFHDRYALRHTLYGSLYAAARAIGRFEQKRRGVG